MNTTTVSALDELLKPYEDRPLGIPRDEAAKRQRGATVSADMHAALGFKSSAAADRLINLWCMGQVTKAEFNALVIEVAQRRLFLPIDNEAVRDGR